MPYCFHNSHYEKLPNGQIQCIDNEIPFEIPDSWEWERFGNLVINRDSERKPLSVVQRNNLAKIYDYYGASGVIDKVDKYLFEKDLLLIGEDGANLISRSTPIAFIAHGKYWVNNHAHVIDCINNLFMHYLETYINAISLVDYITGTAQPKMNQAKMNSIMVCIPPLAEQQRIVERIEKLLPYIEKYDKAQQELDKLNTDIYSLLKKSVLQEAIQGNLVPQDPTDESATELLKRIQQEKQELVKQGKLKAKDITNSTIFKGDDNKYYEKCGTNITCIDDELPFDIPNNWSWVRLGVLMKISTGKKDANFANSNGRYDFFTCSNTPLKCNSYSYCGEYLIMPGNGANIGQVIHYVGEFEAYQRTYLLQSYYNNIVNLEYIKYHLLFNWKEYNQGKLFGSAIPYIKLNNLTSYLVALPPLNEQNRIVAKIENCLGVMCKK